MPDPTIPTAAVAAAALTTTGAVAVPVLTVAGVSLGLRPDVLVAGLAGALCAIALLDAVPSTGDSWRELLRTSGRRVVVALASALTAGYTVPLVARADLGQAVELAGAFLVGAGAQRLLRRWLAREERRIDPAKEGA